MDFTLFRKIAAVIYISLIFAFVIIGFSYTNQDNSEYRESLVFLNDNWVDSNGAPIKFPYRTEDRRIAISNTLPTVYGDQILVLKVYYENFKIFIDGEEVLESKDSTFLGRKTLVGNKEVWVPLDAEYSNKEIKVDVVVQKALYRPWINTAFISTRSGYVVDLLRENAAAAVVYVIFTITGIFEIIGACYFILRRVSLLRQLTFQALFYAGGFSIVTAQWVINETRIPMVIWGHNTGYGVLTVVSFLLMPLLFFEISRSLFLRIRKVDNIVDTILAFSILFCIFPIFFGLYDWGHLIYFTHAFDFIVMILVAYYSYTSLKEESEISLKAGIAIANFVFLALAVIAGVIYIKNSSTDYILIFLLDLLIYIFAQVGLIYRRIGLNVKEEKEFAQAKVYAYTDELTSLGNRRKFYSTIEELEKNPLSENLTYIAIDVNRLKYYNDNMGHEAGDELLKGTAECIKKAFSCETATIARMGGDEFAILVDEPQADVTMRIDTLVRYLAKWKGTYVNEISVAIGMATISQTKVDNIDVLAKIADERMYADKKRYYEKTGIDRRTSN